MPKYQEGEGPIHPVTGERAEWWWPVGDKKAPRWGYRRSHPRDLKKEPETVWLSVNEAVELIGRSRIWVRRKIQAGKLLASRPEGGRKWFIRGSDLIAFVHGLPPGKVLPRIEKFKASK